MVCFNDLSSILNFAIDGVSKAGCICLEGQGGSTPLHRVADPPKYDPKTDLGVDYIHHGWHKDGFTLYSVYCPNSEPPF